MELEVFRVRLHDRAGDDLGLVELPTGWVLEPGDVLANVDGRLVRVTDVVSFPRGSAVAALVRVVLTTQRA